MFKFHQLGTIHQVAGAPMVKGYWEKCDPFLVHGIGAESLATFTERVSSSLEKLKISKQVELVHGYP